MLLFLGIAYLTVLTLVYITQRNFIYFPINEPAPLGFEQFYKVEPVDINVEGVGEITSYFSAPLNDAPVLIVFHGNASEAYQLTNEINSFREWGLGFLIIEYPGYSENPGRISEASILTSAQAHYDWIVSQGIDAKNIVLYGHSLGAASAVHLASTNDIGLLVLSAPFLSARAMARRQMPYFPTSLLLKDQFRSDLKMPSVSAPTVVFHGREDRVIPHSMGESLTGLHTGDATFVSIENGNHNNLWGTAMPTYIHDAIMADVTGQIP